MQIKVFTKVCICLQEMLTKELPNYKGYNHYCKNMKGIVFEKDIIMNKL